MRNRKRPFSDVDPSRTCDFRELFSGLCGKPLKLNVLDRQPTAHRCYRHGKGRAMRRGRVV